MWTMKLQQSDKYTLVFVGPLLICLAALLIGQHLSVDPTTQAPVPDDHVRLLRRSEAIILQARADLIAGKRTQGEQALRSAIAMLSEVHPPPQALADAHYELGRSLVVDGASSDADAHLLVAERMYMQLGFVEMADCADRELARPQH